VRIPENPGKLRVGNRSKNELSKLLEESTAGEEEYPRKNRNTN
jgi:hypothetical protein